MASRKHLSYQVALLCIIIKQTPRKAKMVSTMKTVIVVMALVAILSSVNWQASGQGGWNGAPMSDAAPNLPRLEAILDQAVVNLGSGDTPKMVAQTISQQCSSLWDDAWNVAVAQLFSPDADMVLYGYAFRNHWAWYNKYKGSPYSFAIWKDYNCEEWVSLDPASDPLNSDSTKQNDIYGTIDPPFRSWLGSLGDGETGNPWQAIEIVVPKAEEHDSHLVTYSGVGFNQMETSSNPFGAYFCYGGGAAKYWGYQRFRDYRASLGRMETFYYLFFTTRTGHHGVD